ncbi:NAD+ synthase [Candidatus Woesearchaeota archaeon]|nr:NAD+ synthase [Candidatus Woesearchaeota archaeon]
MKLENVGELYVQDVNRLLKLENPALVQKQIEEFIREKTKRGVVGISGGVDSALITVLSVNALGKENVAGLVMPSDTTNPEDVEDAVGLAKDLGIDYEIINIQADVDSYRKRAKFAIEFALNNAKARIRMNWLYLFTNSNSGYIVIGTDNKTEGTDFGVGYFTKYGDGGVDINPIGGLYKTQVWQLADFVGVPKKIVEKTPTAGLWNGQTDEGELGISYRTLDKVLLGFELQIPDSRIAEVSGAGIEKIEEIRALQLKNKHKGEMPPSPTIMLGGYKKRK